MYQAIGIVELKSIAKGIEATDAALKSAGVKLVSAHPSCPGKYEIILTGGIADVEAAVDHVKGRFDSRLIDSCVIGRIDPQVVTGMFGTQEGAKTGSVGIIETFSAASLIRAADIAVKTAKVGKSKAERASKGGKTAVRASEKKASSKMASSSHQKSKKSSGTKSRKQS